MSTRYYGRLCWPLAVENTCAAGDSDPLTLRRTVALTVNFAHRQWRRVLARPQARLADPCGGARATPMFAE